MVEAYKHVPKLVKIDGIINKKDYLDILQNKLLDLVINTPNQSVK